MRINALFYALLVLIVSLAASSPAAAQKPVRLCGELSADTEVNSAAMEGGDCAVSGLVAGRIGFALRLPLANWNGKLAHVDGQFAHLGCAGTDCGGPVSTRGCTEMVRRGYACLVNDDGDRAPADQQAWARRGAEGAIDFAFRATHLATIAGKRIVERFYGRRPAHAYFLGCSIAGRQGLVEAQRFPHDYDGIVAGAPEPYYLHNLHALAFNARSLLGRDGKTLFPAPYGGYLQPDFRLLHAAILVTCDRDDGVADGIIADPRRCHFDPATLLCAGPKRPDCLSADQVSAIRAIFAGAVDREGHADFLARAMPGSEVNWGYSYLAEDGGSAVVDRLTAQVDAASLDPHGRGGEGVALGEALYRAADPDLRGFRGVGGKMILYQGWSDHEVLPEAIVDYVGAVTAAMGGEASTRRFLRLFMIPAMDHCGNGASADKIDYVGAIEAWVEHDRAPDRLVAARVRNVRLWPGDPAYWGAPGWSPAEIEFTRPIFPYPLRAVYQGRGDTRDAASFVAVGPDR